MAESWAFEWGLQPYVARRDAFPPGYLSRVSKAIRESKYLADNNLNYRFSGTLGYSVIFRDVGRARVLENFPEFDKYLERVLDPRCNAFFLNPLVTSEGARVAPHVDRSLRSLTIPDEPPNPLKVSVLYVEVPSGMRGGRLILYHRLLPLGWVTPRANLLVTFQGFLRHEVTRVSSDRPRISLVCEQYVLDERLYKRIPEFTVRSMSSFGLFFEAEMKRPSPQMTVAEKVTEEQKQALLQEGSQDG